MLSCTSSWYLDSHFAKKVFRWSTFLFCVDQIPPLELCFKSKTNQYVGYGPYWVWWSVLVKTLINTFWDHNDQDFWCPPNLLCNYTGNSVQNTGNYFPKSVKGRKKVQCDVTLHRSELYCTVASYIAPCSEANCPNQNAQTVFCGKKHVLLHFFWFCHSCGISSKPRHSCIC